MKKCDTHRKIIVTSSCSSFPSQGGPDEGTNACSLAPRWPAKVVGEDMPVTKFRLQVAGRTLGEGLKLQEGGLSGSLKNLNLGVLLSGSITSKHLGQLLLHCWFLGVGGEAIHLHNCSACEASAGRLSAEQRSQVSRYPLKTLGCPLFAPKVGRHQLLGCQALGTTLQTTGTKPRKHLGNHLSSQTSGMQLSTSPEV